MRTVGFGDGATAAALRRFTDALKSDIDRFTSEAATGLVRDPAAHLGGDLAPLAGLQADLARLGAYRTNIATAGLTATAMQSALSRLDESASSYATALLAAAGSSQPTAFAATLGEGEERFDEAMRLLNTRIGDRSLFAGTRSQSAATATSAEILDWLEALVASAAGADEVAALVEEWFDDPAGFGAQGYLGGAALAPIPVGTDDTVALDVTAADPALRGTLVALALTALLDRGVLAESETARADLALRAGERLIGEQTDRTDLSARLGLAEQRIAEAGTRERAETSATEIARAGLIAADPYDTATRLAAVESQLETLYAITARLSRLSLVDYLR